MDIISFENGRSIEQLQQDDLFHFGQLILALACGTMLASHNMTRSMEFVSSKFSPDIKNVLIYLLYNPTQYKNIQECTLLLGKRIFGVLDDIQLYLVF